MLIATKKQYLGVTYYASLEKVTLQKRNIMNYCNTVVFCHTLPQTRNLQMPALALLWMNCSATCYVGSWRVSLQNLGVWGTLSLRNLLSLHIHDGFAGLTHTSESRCQPGVTLSVRVGTTLRSQAISASPHHLLPAFG